MYIYRQIVWENMQHPPEKAGWGGIVRVRPALAVLSAALRERAESLADAAAKRLRGTIKWEKSRLFFLTLIVFPGWLWSMQQLDFSVK